MECIEARALKSSFLSQMAMKTPNSHQNDDVWCFAGINNVASDDFLVEDLLNLDFPEEIHEDVDDNKETVSQKRNSDCSESIFSGSDEFDCLSAGPLGVPADELELQNLEWFSEFVDDTKSEPSLLLPTESFTSKTGVNFMTQAEPVKKPVQIQCFTSPVPVKARTKRLRSNGRPWPLRSPQMSAAENSSTTSASSNGSSSFIFTDWFSSVEKPHAKKLKRKAESETGSITGRRCTHCQVQKTPQWRTGPLGPKTLCNACGVRFKSGRLFPEYRPACSPTFSQEVHSNSHRKVLEMRRKKEVGPVVETGLARAVQSF